MSPKENRLTVSSAPSQSPTFWRLSREARNFSRASCGNWRRGARRSPRKKRKQSCPTCVQATTSASDFRGAVAEVRFSGASRSSRK